MLVSRDSNWIWSSFFLSLFITHTLKRVKMCLSVISNFITLPHQHLYLCQGRRKAKWKPRIGFRLLSAHQQISRGGPRSVLNLYSLAWCCQTAPLWSLFQIRSTLMSSFSWTEFILLNRVLSVAANNCRLHLRCCQYGRVCDNNIDEYVQCGHSLCCVDSTKERTSFLLHFSVFSATVVNPGQIKCTNSAHSQYY